MEIKYGSTWLLHVFFWKFDFRSYQKIIIRTTQNLQSITSKNILRKTDTVPIETHPLSVSIIPLQHVFSRRNSINECLNKIALMLLFRCGSTLLMNKISLIRKLNLIPSEAGNQSLLNNYTEIDHKTLLIVWCFYAVY